MSYFVLDTDILTLFQEGHAIVRQHFNSVAPQDLAITVLSVEEQMSGWYTFIRKAKRIDRLALGYRSLVANVQSLRDFRILTFDEPAILRYQGLRKLNLNVRKMDLRIAAVVQENGETLVTRNVRDFAQVPGLIFVNWSV